MSERRLRKETSPPTSGNREEVQRGRSAASLGMKKRRSSKTGGNDRMGYYIVIGIFVAVCVGSIFFILLNPKRALSEISVVEDDKIIVHNSQNYMYKQGFVEMFKDWSWGDVKEITRNSLSNRQNIPLCSSRSDANLIVPESFDARTKWPECVSEVRSQKNCSSSYAIAALSTLSDRICISTNGKEKVNLSPQEILSCDTKNYGCEGGYVNVALDYGIRKGFSLEEDFPYAAENTPCEPRNKEQVNHKVGGYCIANGPEGIKREIFKYGPVVGGLTLFTDFLVYKDGTYHLTEESSRFNGQHIVKIVGWEKGEEGREAWIIQNSWGTDWGTDGYARISANVPDLRFDQFAIAPVPAIEFKGAPVPTQGQEEISEETIDIDTVELKRPEDRVAEDDEVKAPKERTARKEKKTLENEERRGKKTEV